jgi:ligand-binding sensor domain-containing protein/two-component sensor histidine kinase
MRPIDHPSSGKNLMQFLLLIFALLSGISLNAQKVQFRNFNVKEGLSQSQVYDITEDYKGRLWLATRGGGISIYDGLGFKSITQKNGLSNDFVYCFYKDPQQNIWIGTNDGLNFYNGKSITRYFPENLGEQVWIQQIVEDRKHRLWLASKKGLLKFENGKFENISEEQHQPKLICNTVFLDGDSVLFFGNDFGLFRLNINTSAGNIQKVTLGATDPNISVNKLIRNKKGELIVGSYGYGLFKMDQGKLVRYLDDVVSRTEKVWNLFEDKQTLYVATLEHGVIAYNDQNKKTEIIDEQRGLSNNHVRKIFKDRNGNLWFGTSGGGVSNFGGQVFTHFDKASGLPDNFVYSMLQTPDRKVLVGAGNYGVTVMANDSIKVYNARNGFINTKVKSIKAYNNDLMLIGTEGDGLFIMQGDSFRFVSQIGRQFIKDIETDQNGNIWLATAGNGIYRLKPLDAALTQFDVRQFIDHLINPRIQFLNTQLNGKVFYCTENQGVGMIEQEQESKLRLNTATGIYSNLTRSIVISPKKMVYIATNDKGISAFDLVHSKPVDFDNSLLPSLNIYLMKMDRKGNLVLGTERGLDYVVLDSAGKIFKVKHYSIGDGFLGIETCLNAVAENPDGSFWIGTIGGLTLFNPAKGTTNTKAPLINLSGIKLFYKPIETTRYGKQLNSDKVFDALVLPYNQNHLTFDFDGVNLSNGEGVTYKWKLEGFDETWSPVSNQHSVTYSNLPPGQYTLLINAANEDGIWNNKPFRYSFEIKKPFWMQWWFIGLMALLLVLLVYKIIQWRTRRIKRESAEKQKELQLANQLQSLEHKALRLQMNPHFIFNALNSIQSQIGNNNDQEARYYIAKFGKLMRQILNHSENAWVNLHEELEMIENYLLIEQFCNNKKFKYELDIQSGLLEEEYKIPSMIVQPFIENAIKHGFKNLTEREGVLKLSFLLKDKTMLCVIEDNGVGRGKPEPAKDTAHQSMAINITQKRLQILHENMKEEFVTITDLVNNEKPSGTKVSIILPVQ